MNRSAKHAAGQQRTGHEASERVAHIIQSNANAGANPRHPFPRVAMSTPIRDHIDLDKRPIRSLRQCPSWCAASSKVSFKLHWFASSTLMMLRIPERPDLIFMQMSCRVQAGSPISGNSSEREAAGARHIAGGGRRLTKRVTVTADGRAFRPDADRNSAGGPRAQNRGIPLRVIARTARLIGPG